MRICYILEKCVVNFTLDVLTGDDSDPELEKDWLPEDPCGEAEPFSDWCGVWVVGFSR